MDAAIATKKPVAPKPPRKARKANLKSVPATPESDTAPDPNAKLQTRVDVAELRRVITQLGGVVDIKSSMPMLRNVLVRADRANVTFVATDLNTTLTVTVKASDWASGSGATTVECRRLRDILRVLPDGVTTLESKDGASLRMHVDGCTTHVHGLPANDFPKTPDASTVEWSSVDGGILRDLLERVSDTVCRDESRFHLNGVYLETSDGERMVAVSTDGHRLSKAQRAYKTSFANKGVIIPSGAVRELRKLLVAEMCEVGIRNNLLFVRQGEWALTTKLIDAQFPPYEQVIPSDPKLLVTCDRQRLIDACKRARALCTDTRGVAMSVANGKLVLQSDNPDVGELAEKIDADYIPRTATDKVGVNPSFLQGALERTDGERCVLGIRDELDPILVRSLEDATQRTISDAEFLVVVMPMRI